MDDFLLHFHKLYVWVFFLAGPSISKKFQPGGVLGETFSLYFASSFLFLIGKRKILLMDFHG